MFKQFSDIELLYGLKHAFSEESRKMVLDELVERGVDLPARSEEKRK